MDSITDMEKNGEENLRGPYFDDAEKAFRQGNREGYERKAQSIPRHIQETMMEMIEFAHVPSKETLIAFHPELASDPETINEIQIILKEQIAKDVAEYEQPPEKNLEIPTLSVEEIESRITETEQEFFGRNN